MRKAKIIVRIVVPSRDYKKVKPILDELALKGYKPIMVRRDVLFKERRDLDSIEVIYRLEMSILEARRLKKKIASAIRGTIGFFLMYKER